MLTAFLQQQGIQFSQNPDILKAAREDFGHLTEGGGIAVILPNSLTQIQELLLYANEQNIKVAIRTGGLTQSAQSIAVNNAVTLDLSHLHRITNFSCDAAVLSCEPATTWREVIATTLTANMLPYVLPYNLDLSIAGVLSVGGFGAASHKYGACITHVNGMKVVTSDGSLRYCNPQEYSDLFNHVLAGVGRFGVIAEVEIPLRVCGSHVRSYYLLYDDMHAWLADQHHLSKLENIDYLEAFCSPLMQGSYVSKQIRQPLSTWFYSLQVSVEYNAPQTPNDRHILSNLHFWRHLATDDTVIAEFCARTDSRLAQLRHSEAWQQTHPWFETFLPANSITDLLPKILAELPPTLGGGHHLHFMNTRQLPTNLMAPTTEQAIALTILPPGIAQQHLPTVLASLHKLAQWTREAGGKRYLAGWLGDLTDITVDYWKQHYGEHYQTWLNSKIHFDPKNILQSLLFFAHDQAQLTTLHTKKSDNKNY